MTSQNDGIFFISHTDFLTCFDDFQIAHYRDNEGYSDDWYDKETDDGQMTQFEVTVPAQNGDLYFSVDGFYQGAVPQSCFNGDFPIMYVAIYKNDMSNVLFNYAYYDAFHWPFEILEANYAANDKFII